MNRKGDDLLLEEALRRLKLPTILREFRECARQAREAGDSHENFLLAVATRELEQRQQRQLERRLAEAHFPVLKTLEATDLKKWPGLDVVQLRQYTTCEYIDRRENLILIGKHGTGKTHAATVLGVEACRGGYRVLFTTAADLINTLVEAREERQLKRHLAKLNRYALLIVDELGYIPFSTEGAQLLFQVFSNRYEKGSLLVTSNLPFAQWTSIFGEATLTAALLDRLTHHSFIHEFTWESLRLADSLHRKKQAAQHRPQRSGAATAARGGIA
jgi:DNA replication protein DnaC